MAADMAAANQAGSTIPLVRSLGILEGNRALMGKTVSIEGASSRGRQIREWRQSWSGQRRVEDSEQIRKLREVERPRSEVLSCFSSQERDSSTPRSKSSPRASSSRTGPRSVLGGVFSSSNSDSENEWEDQSTSSGGMDEEKDAKEKGKGGETGARVEDQGDEEWIGEESRFWQNGLDEMSSERQEKRLRK